MGIRISEPPYPRPVLPIPVNWSKDQDSIVIPYPNSQSEAESTFHMRHLFGS
jgi:hypothetical protein